ncbi:hypothetical protein GGE07_002890 [Sinorhizobium terangae]|nr:hypothetical protein [Sinorhizobium terangae]
MNPTSPWYFETFLARSGRKGTVAGGISIMTSSSAATPAASPIWSACWELGGVPKKSPSMVSFHRAQLGIGSRSGYRPRDVASCCRGAVHPATRPFDASTGKKGRCPEAGIYRIRRDAAWRRASPESFAAKDRKHWTCGSTMRSTQNAFRSCVFACVLRRDIDAVDNAIELPWSNGQAEGQINRLKTLKPAMYGRAGPELLRARMLRLRHTN